MASIEVFCCYAHKDAPLLESLKAHLTLLQKQGLISLWSDTNISPGSEWEKEIETINKTVVENNTTLSENACALIADQAKQLDGFLVFTESETKRIGSLMDQLYASVSNFRLPQRVYGVATPRLQ